MDDTKIELEYKEFITFYIISILIYGVFSFGIAELIIKYIL
jgi:hypothetical protein